MSEKSMGSFHINELIAIEIALESSIDEINYFLADDETDFLFRPKLQENLRWSSSALEKVKKAIRSLPSE